jgi:SNF2 domain-containing protein/SprT-like family protein
MTRLEAAQLARNELNLHNLQSWGVRLHTGTDGTFLGMCMHRDKVIVLNAYHVEMHPDVEVKNTIRHEIAHALTPGHAHDEFWAAKAKEIGCDNTQACSNLSLPSSIVDAIRSGATVEVTFEEEVIRRPKYTVTRLQDKCEYCGKVAKTLKETTVEVADITKPDLKIIQLECGHTLIKKIPKGTQFGQFQMGGDPKCEHNWDKNKCTKCGRFRPYQFQIEGMKFLETALAVNKGGAVFDEMGLGKTIQAGGVIYFHEKELCPTLWIVKSGLKYQFSSFLINWLGDKHVPQIINKSSDWLIPGLKHYIVGYDMLVPKVRQLKSGKIATQGFDIEKFDKIGIKCVVLDECQQIKNAGSTRTQMVRRVVKDKKVIPLSGTPWKNKGSELFPVFNMMDPFKFHNEELFKRTWVSTYWVGNILKEGGIRNPEKFREYTKDICIRRERTEVMSELPLINRTKLVVNMSTEQETVYDEAVEEFVKWYEAQEASISGMAIIAAMQKMRHLIGLAKIPATKDYVAEFVEDTDRKIVVFAHHKDVQAILYDDFKTEYGEEMPVLKISSDMNGAERFDAQEKFNSAPRAILVASTLAAGEGLNLQTCADCIIHERQWNPANEEQAEGRFIRIGQTATTVNSVYAHCVGLSTIDPHLDGIVERKRIQFHNAMNKTEYQEWSQESIAKELADAIVSDWNRKRKKAS